jgi:hypothetical protein
VDAKVDMRGTLTADAVSGTISVGRDCYATLTIADDITSDGEIVVTRDFRGNIAAGELAGTIEVSNLYGDVDIEGDIAASGEFTVAGVWGSIVPAKLIVGGTLSGHVTNGLNATKAYIEVNYIGQTGYLAFGNDFRGTLLVPFDMAAGSTVYIGRDVRAPLGPAPQTAFYGIYIGYEEWGSGQMGVKGHLTVGDELCLPLQVSGVAITGWISIGSIPDPDPQGYDTLGVYYYPVEGQISVAGALDGECVIRAIESGGRFQVGGDMTALFKIWTYAPCSEGYIGAQGVVQITGPMSGGAVIDNILPGGRLEVGSIASSCEIGVLAGDVVVNGDVAGNCGIEVVAVTASLEITGDLVEEYIIDAYDAMAGTIAMGDLWGMLDVAGAISGTITTADLRGTPTPTATPR